MPTQNGQKWLRWHRPWQLEQSLFWDKRFLRMVFWNRSVGQRSTICFLWVRRICKAWWHQAYPYLTIPPCFEWRGWKIHLYLQGGYRGWEERQMSHRLAGFLLTYRTTPHSTTGVSPCELLVGRHLRTHWYLLKPDSSQNVCQRQAKQTERRNQHARFRRFDIGQSVMVKNFGSGDSWIAGVIA